jgi:hypothetical protein
MRAITAAHRHAAKKGHVELNDERSSKRDSSGLANTSFLDEEYVEEKVEKKDSEDDEEYNDERDHLVIFPPEAYRKGDVELGVLMSG